MTKLPFRAFLLTVALFSLTLTGCATSTTVSTVWKSPDPSPGDFTKVIAIVLNATPAERRAGEDELVQSIKSAHAVPSYTLISDEDLKDRAKVRTLIKDHGFDTAAIINLISSQQRTTYVPPRYNSTHDPLDYGSNFPTAAVLPGYTTTDTFITTEVSLYSVRDQKLIWAGSSTTEDPANIQDLIGQIARAAAAELRRQGIIK